MSSPEPMQHRHTTIWRLLTVGGLLVGAGSLLGHRARKMSGRGRHSGYPSAGAVAAGHETRDINVRKTAGILAGMAATTALVIGLVFVMVWQFDIRRQAAMSDLTPQQTARVVPPAPHLQVEPYSDLAEHEARQQRLLHSWGYTSADHSTARIPIDRAMAMSVGKSLDAPP